MYETVDSVANVRELVVFVEEYQSMEVPISDVSDDGRLQPVLLQVFLRLVHEFRQLRHRHTRNDAFLNNQQHGILCRNGCAGTRTKHP